jgi:hypothetical protein
MKSDIAFKIMTKIFNDKPELFDCRILSQADPSQISKTLKDYGLGRQNTVAANWVENAQKMIDRYDGDPLNIFNGDLSYDDCVNRIKNDGENGFRGFREKMTSMILYFLIDEGIISGLSFPPPVDFHVQRVVLATEMITVEPSDFHRCDTFENAVRGLLSGYLENRDVTPLELTDSIWLLSSNLCNQSPGNYSPKDNITRPFMKEIDPNNLRQGELYRKSCGKCALNKFCEYYIPSGPYYTKAVISLKEKTVKDFVEQLSFFE